MHISHLVFRRDDVHGNAHDLGVRQIHRQTAAQRVHPLFCDGVLLRVEMLDIIGKRHLDVKSFAAALDGKVEMVGQGIGQVCIQGAIQFFPGCIGDIVRRQKHGFRHIAEKCKILLVHIVKGALDAGKIGQFIGHGGKADALAKDNELPALCIAGKCNVIVDLLVNFHV